MLPLHLVSTLALISGKPALHVPRTHIAAVLDIKAEVLRRRNLAIISHPDAGKTTLTEKLLLYGGAINKVHHAPPYTPCCAINPYLPPAPAWICVRLAL